MQEYRKTISGGNHDLVIQGNCLERRILTQNSNHATVNMERPYRAEILTQNGSHTTVPVEILTQKGSHTGRQCKNTERLSRVEMMI